MISGRSVSLRQISSAILKSSNTSGYPYPKSELVLTVRCILIMSSVRSRSSDSGIVAASSSARSSKRRASVWLAVDCAAWAAAM